MTFIKVLHNPEAGEGEHSKQMLLNNLSALGYKCSYTSTKKTLGVKTIPRKTDIIALAGGDGTVRKLAAYILKQSVLEKRFLIGLLPSGTANNIARTLGIDGSPEEIMRRWQNRTIQRFDIGKVMGLKDSRFFLEGLGFGVFPKLMKEMKKRKTKSEDPEVELQHALHKLFSIVENYTPRFCHIVLDDMEYSGEFLMVEILNIRSIGPNLNIAPNADPADGALDVILISSTERSSLINYVHNRMINGKDEAFFYTALKAKKLEIMWEGPLLHLDDELINLEPSKKITIEIVEGVLNFLV